MTPEERVDVLERMKLLHSDYLAELRADWERQKTLLAMNGAAAVALTITGVQTLGAVVACNLAAALALASVWMLLRSRRALWFVLQKLLEIEHVLRLEPAPERLKDPDRPYLLAALFAAIAVFDLWLAFGTH